MKRFSLFCIVLTCTLFAFTACDEEKITPDDNKDVIYYQLDSMITRDADGNLLRAQSFNYDEEGNVTKVTDWNNGEEWYWENSGYIARDVFTKQVVYYKENGKYEWYQDLTIEVASDHKVMTRTYYNGFVEQDYYYLDKDGRTTGFDVYYTDADGQLYHDFSCRYELDDHGNITREEYDSPVDADYYVLFLHNYTYQTFGDYTQYTSREDTYGDGYVYSKDIYEYDEVGNNIAMESYTNENGALVLDQRWSSLVNKDMDTEHTFGICIDPWQPNPYLLTSYYDKDDNLLSTMAEYHSIHHTEAATRAKTFIPMKSNFENYLKPLKRPAMR